MARTKKIVATAAATKPVTITDLIAQYRNVKFPERPGNQPVLKNSTDPVAIRQFADDMEKYNEKLAVYRAGKDVVKEEQGRIFDLIRAKALDEAGIADVRNADDIWAKAWDMGHSSGFEEVISYLDDLAELVKGALGK